LQVVFEPGGSLHAVTRFAKEEEPRLSTILPGVTSALPSSSSVAAPRLSIASSETDTEYVLSPPMMHAVKVLTEAAEAETARLTPQDAMDAIELVRDRLLALQSKHRRAAQPHQ
jgi:hypothetical protein